MVQTLARQSVSVLDFAEDDVIFCTGNMAVASYSIMQGAAGWQWPIGGARAEFIFGCFFGDWGYGICFVWGIFVGWFDIHLLAFRWGKIGATGQCSMLMSVMVPYCEFFKYISILKLRVGPLLWVFGGNTYVDPRKENILYLHTCTSQSGQQAHWRRRQQQQQQQWQQQRYHNQHSHFRKTHTCLKIKPKNARFPK